MKKYSTIIITINLLLLLGYINYSIYAKEQTITNGKLVLLRLAPVDPRSLIQGDYMRLNYGISSNSIDSISKKGYCIVITDNNHVGKKIRFQKTLQPLLEGESAIQYSKPDSWALKIGAESFFFQEGEAAKYDSAKYGGLRIDEKGNSVLVGLFDSSFQRIK